MHTYAIRAASAVIGAVLIAPATSARADAGDTLHGGCGYTDDFQNTVVDGQHAGVIYLSSVTLHASGLPSTATVSCWIEVDGVEAPNTRITETDTGVQTGERVISFTARDDQLNALCQQVTFADGSTWTGFDGTNPDCPGPTPI